MARVAISGRSAVSGRAAVSGRLAIPVTENLLANGIDTDSSPTWTRINVGSPPQPLVSAPDGTTTARGLVGTGGTTLHRILYSHTTVPAIGTTFMIRGYVRAGSDRWIRVLLNNLNSGINIDMQLGVIGTTTATVSQSIEDAGLRDYPSLGLGSGWWRFVVTAVATTLPASGQFWTVNADSSSSSASDGVTVNGYVWGVQVARTNRNVPISHTTGTALVASLPGIRYAP